MRSPLLASLTLAALGATAMAIAPTGGTALAIDWSTIDGGGGRSSAGPLVLDGTIGQPDGGGPLSGGDLAMTGGFWTGAATIPPPPACEGDLDESGSVDGADLGLLLGNWAGEGLGDLNGDGIVDGADLGLLLGAWGPCKA
jgi:hypothetical protein